MQKLRLNVGSSTETPEWITVGEVAAPVRIFGKFQLVMDRGMPIPLFSPGAHISIDDGLIEFIRELSRNETETKITLIFEGYLL
jgi:hypothetical protein